MPAKEYSGRNFSYIIDADHRFVTMSDGMLEIYPHLKPGQLCYEAIYNASSPCAMCPLREAQDRELTVYNPVIERWVNAMCVDVDWPGTSNCTMIACSVINDDNGAIMHRLPYMAGYDVFFEMNLTQNKFRRFFRGAVMEPGVYEEESLDSLMSRTIEALVHPFDQRHFREFWDLGTMMERLRQSNGMLHDEFVERNSRGGWDLIHTTIVPDSTFGAKEDIVIAMYTVIRSPQLAQVAIDATQVDAATLDVPRTSSNLEKLLTQDAFLKMLPEKLHAFLAGSRCVMCFDVENFRFFNRWLGREAGDALLEGFATFLVRLDQEHNILPAHLGADRFALFLPFNRYLAQRVADELRSILDDASGDMGFRLSIGATLCSTADQPAADLLDEARTAAHRSLESAGADLVWYDVDIAAAREKRVHTIAEINEGLQKGQFEAYFQPKCHMGTGQVIGAEALARWRHPGRGIVTPGAFVPVLESTGGITRLDLQIWESTFASLRSWLDKDLSVPPVSINVSRYDIGAMDVAEVLLGLARQYDMDPEYVEVEITESVLAEDSEVVRSTIDRLRTNGFAVAIDDFGSGYSSLNMLKDIPADVLKLDLKFLDFSQDNSSKGVTIIRSVIEMSHTLGLPVVVEGVETQEQVSVLTDPGCRYAQGRRFFSPMPSREFERAISNPSSVITEGVCKHYARTASQRTSLAQNDFDDAILDSLAMPVVMYELDGEDINIIKFNEPFTRFVGSEELVRRSHGIQRYVNEQDLPKVYSALHRAAADPTKTTRCHMRVTAEDGTVIPFDIAFNLSSRENGLLHFLGLPMRVEGVDQVALYESKFSLINRQWLDELCELGELSEEIVEDVSGAVALYYLKDDQVHLKGCNKAVMEIFKVHEKDLSSIADRDVMQNMNPAEIAGILANLERAMAHPDQRIECDARFIRHVDGKKVNCHLGIHYVREYDGGHEFISSLVPTGVDQS